LAWGAFLLQIKVPIARTVFEVIRIHCGVGLILTWDVFLGEDGLRGADRNTRAAVNARIGINVEIFAPVGIVLRTWDDAVYRADLNTVALAGT
jgi:hypothetical protein